MTGDNEAAWHAVYTESKQEYLACKSLRAAGYRVFYPYYMVQQRIRPNSRKVIGVMKPLFPRYLFITDPAGLGLMAANTAQGVAGVLHDEAGPYAIPNSEIEMIRQRCDHDGRAARPKERRQQRRTPLPVNAAVSIIDGPLKTAVGFVDHDEGLSETVAVSVEMMGRRIRANIVAECLKLTGGMRPALDNSSKF